MPTADFPLQMRKMKLHGGAAEAPAAGKRRREKKREGATRSGAKTGRTVRTGRPVLAPRHCHRGGGGSGTNEAESAAEPVQDSPFGTHDDMGLAALA